MVKISRSGIQLPFYSSSEVVHAGKLHKKKQADTNAPYPLVDLSRSPTRVASVPTLSCLTDKRNTRVPLKKRMKRSESSVFALREPKDCDLKKPQLNSNRNMKPDEFFERIIQKSGVSAGFMTVDPKSFLAIEKQQLSSYPQAALAARNEDLELLKQLHREGHNLQCSNKFGESIIHIVCRRSRDDILDFLVSEANVSLRLQDDLGRTPLHDAAWTERPNFKVVHQILVHEPDLIVVRDNRGNSPLSYIPRQNWGIWNQFLEENQDSFLTALK